MKTPADRKEIAELLALILWAGADQDDIEVTLGLIDDLEAAGIAIVPVEMTATMREAMWGTRNRCPGDFDQQFAAALAASPYRKGS